MYLFGGSLNRFSLAAQGSNDSLSPLPDPCCQEAACIAPVSGLSHITYVGSLAPLLACSHTLAYSRLVIAHSWSCPCMPSLHARLHASHHVASLTMSFAHTCVCSFAFSLSSCCILVQLPSNSPLHILLRLRVSGQSPVVRLSLFFFILLFSKGFGWFSGWVSLFTHQRFLTFRGSANGELPVGRVFWPPGLLSRPCAGQWISPARPRPAENWLNLGGFVSVSLLEPAVNWFPLRKNGGI